MRKTYIAKRMPQNADVADFSGGLDLHNLSVNYNALNESEISEYPWTSEYPNRFEARFRLGYTNDNLFVLMYAFESPILSNETKFGGEQCRDSCLEFFVKPFPEKDDRYINVEINPAGVPHVGLGESRYGRRVFYEAIPGMKIATATGNGAWAVSFNLPAAFVTELFGAFPKAGDTLCANFYKCSVDIHPHFGSWNAVISPRPDFHRPECFGDIALES